MIPGSFLTLLEPTWLDMLGPLHSYASDADAVIFPMPNFISYAYLQRAKMTDFDRFKVMKAKRMVSSVHTWHYFMYSLDWLT